MFSFLYHCQTRQYIWVTRWVPDHKQELLTLRVHLSSLPIPDGSVLRIALVVCTLLLCICSIWVPCCDVRYGVCIKPVFGSFLPPVFVGGLMFYLCYLSFVAHSGVEHTLCCVSALVFLIFCTLCSQSLWNVNFRLLHQYSLTFMWLILRYVWFNTFDFGLLSNEEFEDTKGVTHIEEKQTTQWPKEKVPLNCILNSHWISIINSNTN